MARKPRIKVSGTAAGYHIVTRTRGREFILDNNLKKYFSQLLIKLKKLYFVKYGAYTVLDNHYHLLIRFNDPDEVDSREAMERWNAYHEGTPFKRNGSLESHRNYVVRELTDLSSFMKRFNQLLTLRYNVAHECTGTLWERRYRSSVVERGTATILCAAYIELNAFRAGIVDCPENYPHSSIYWLHKGNRHGLIDRDLISEGLGCDARDADEFNTTYRAYIYAAGSRVGKDNPDGLTITEQMQGQLARYGLKPEKGFLSIRLDEMINSKVTAGRDFAQHIYESHINPGLTGEQKSSHLRRWLHGFISGLWCVCHADPSRGSP